MEIRVYTPALNLLGLIENHTSLIWTRKYYEPGTFEIHAPLTAENLKLLQAGNIISKKGSNEAGVIEDIENDDVTNTKQEVARKGRFISSYLDRRLIKSTINYSGTVENAMRQLVSGVTAIPLIQLGAAQGLTETVQFQVTMKNLCTILTKLARSSALGYRLRPDFVAKALYFEVYKGVDHTSAQSKKTRVIFSEEYENLNDAVYKLNNQLLKTLAVVGGEGEGAARTYVTVGEGTGLDLREMFVDAKDLSSDGLTAAQYQAVLRQRGLEKLAENIVSESLECKTDPNINFVYHTNYDLGDIVTVEKRSWGLKMYSRITELSEVYQWGGMSVHPTLGDPMPETIDWGSD
jgi:hypothetical protein